MELSEQQIIRANHLYYIAKKLLNENPETFKQMKMFQCSSCGSTGLKGYKKLSTGDFAWSHNGDGYCTECNGIGYKNMEGLYKYLETKGLYVCKNCDAVGCLECKQTGFVDWIKHARGL